MAVGQSTFIAVPRHRCWSARRFAIASADLGIAAAQEKHQRHQRLLQVTWRVGTGHYRGYVDQLPMDMSIAHNALLCQIAANFAENAAIGPD